MTHRPVAAIDERALTFACGGETLCGIVSLPPAGLPKSPTGVVVIVGGPQYRAGSHRQFVHLARTLAAAGHPVLRFDYRGMGDSGGDQRDFEHCRDDVRAAIDALVTADAGVSRVVLWGLCDAASAALLYVDAVSDARVAGLALLNPWVRSEAGLARAQVKHYYLQRLRQRDFWIKLLRGRVARSALATLRRNLRLAARASDADSSDASNFRDRMARGWRSFDGPVLLMLSDQDLTAREFLEYTAANAAWRRTLSRRPALRCELMGADHTCSSRDARLAAEAATLSLLRSLPAATASTGTMRKQ